MSRTAKSSSRGEAHEDAALQVHAREQQELAIFFHDGWFAFFRRVFGDDLRGQCETDDGNDELDATRNHMVPELLVVQKKLVVSYEFPKGKASERQYVE